MHVGLSQKNKKKTKKNSGHIYMDLYKTSKAVNMCLYAEPLWSYLFKMERLHCGASKNNFHIHVISPLVAFLSNE